MNDLIIDCFAGGGGASVGIEMALGRPVDIAINHDPDAILMHKTNHPDTLHLTEDIFKVDLKKYVKGRHVALMWASPDCTSHSKAKGGKPREQGLRILPWAVFKHAKAILPEVVLMENVEEIQQWGPLDENGHIIKERHGEDHRKFITAMKSLGYAFDCRELVAADYEAPTTRKRWYAVFRRDGREIIWPEPTHLIKQRVEYYRDNATAEYVDVCAGLREAERIIRKHMNDGWIPVKERWPEEAGVYDFTVKNGIGVSVVVTWQFLSGKHLSGMQTLVDGKHYLADNIKGDPINALLIKNVIAWRKRPEPYTETTSDEKHNS